MFQAIVHTVPGLLSAEECQAEIDRAEALGFEEAPITTGAGFVRAPEVRNNTRVMRDDPAQSALLWERVRAVVPEVPGWRAVGLNERFRLYRYEAGQYFKLHSDGSYRRPQGGQASQLTFMVYLNEGFGGGATRILDHSTIQPRTGMALLFAHQLLHESTALRSGRKYVLRSDVMCVRA